MTLQKNRILVVEDEFLIARDLKNILSSEGHEVIIDLDNVKTAIEEIESKQPNLVLIDLHLSDGADGIDLGYYLNKKDTIPFIYITSYTDKITMNRVHETRPYGFIVKPFKPIDVLTTVSVVLNNFSHRKIDVVRAQQELTNEAPFILKNIVNHINDNLHTKISVTDLAQLTKWKSQHFQRVFTKFMGVNPNDYIKNLKIEKAKTLLIETDMSICDISFDLGFKSQSNFFSLFKTVTGMTPESFRNKFLAQKRVNPKNS